MPIFEKEKKGGIGGIFLILIVIMGILAGFIYNSQVTASPNPNIKDMKPISPEDALSKLKNSKLDFSILENETFTNLKTIGDIPVIPGETGRDNIFAPF